MSKMPQVRQFMTAVPHTIAADAPLEQIQECMREFRVRHLPVKKGNLLVGVVSDRSVKSAIGLRECASLTAEDVMVRDPFTVLPDTALDQVAAEMAEEKYGCALVQDEAKRLVGIFTTVDACRALRQVLENLYPE